MGVPVRDRAAVMPEFLKSVRELDYPKENMGLHFIVNDSTDDTERILEEFKRDHGDDYRFCEVEIENLGAPKDRRTTVRLKHIYRNLAYFRTKILRLVGRYQADYLFTIDSDIYVRPPCLRRLLSFGVDVISAFVSVDYNKGRIGNMMVRKAKKVTGMTHVPNPEPGVYEVDSTGGVVLVSRRVAYSGVEYKFHPLGEDPGFVESLHENGFNAYCVVGEDLAYHDMHKM